MKAQMKAEDDSCLGCCEVSNPKYVDGCPKAKGRCIASHPGSLLDALTKCSFLRGQRRGRDKCLEKELFQKTIPMKLIHVPNHLEDVAFLQK